MLKRQEEPSTARPDQTIVEERSQNSEVIKRYVKGKMLGKGGFAKCFEFTSLDTKKLYAAKIIEKASLTRAKAKQKLTSEIKIHKSLKFPYIVGFEHFFEDAENVYILLEVCPNQTLNELIKRRKRITQVEAQCYLYQLALALKYLHSNRVIHRDLKLGNLFLSDKLEIKIGDFGLAAKLDSDSEKRKTMCGTPNYIAPEILDNKSGHSYQVDVWSFGVIAYAMLVGRPPFETSDVRATYNKIRMCNYSFPDSITLSKAAKSFISKMLQLEPAKRMTVEEILNHEFFTMNPFPRTLPIACLACPPNANFMKQFQRDSSVDKKSTDKLNSSKLLEMPGSNTQRVLSLGQHKPSSTRGSTEQLLGPNQRAASSTALVGHKGIVKKKQIDENLFFENKGPEIWVTHFVENSKFGICYLLNSNCTGMYFNDMTTLITNCSQTKIKYIEPSSEGPRQQVYEMVNSQPSIAKKMKIINHFNTELRNKREDQESKMRPDARIKAEKLKYKKETPETAMQMYVQKYLVTPKATIFWFPKSALQIIFQDNTEILIKESSNGVYVNKFGERKNFNCSDDVQSMPDDLQKRYKYTMELLREHRSRPRNNRLSSSSNNHRSGNDENRKPSISKNQNIQHNNGNSTNNSSNTNLASGNMGHKKESMPNCLSMGTSSTHRMSTLTQMASKKQLPRNSSYGRFMAADSDK